ncbi:alpha-L-fucosidase [Paenibacillus glucanolyticus]|jgi:alpha-L-fucosidase|uniref:alpha-L-fucosidase n=1 Tax=Paenibacillus TaxID=44249 RepID=UPI0003E27C54|nr:MULTISPECIES: alpha-L-fucosidase [Paenibacillus]ANA78797.1 alpha-L-fucosidase [Paenibacillus glucanolyticus]AVV57289.1 alpha-L-fucosidase [Paenibacillus glucanolyticus]ETT32494.1 alpha-L-fucosidase [Paenibacillus sp. FSL R5-808]
MTTTTTPSNQVIQDRNQRVQWFQNDRFGMFIHWGLYSIPARGEWLRSSEQMSIEDYQTYFDEFDPVDYNPREWAKAAKKAGMKYAVLTAKHHDGFCLFDSKLTDYKSTNTKAGRDLVQEFLEAFREEGLKVGLYFSLIDWHHEDYPAYGDRIHPMRGNESFKRDPKDFDRYLDYMHGQVRELLTGYGKLDIMWFDFSYDTMRGEVWRATELMKMIRELQPHILIDNRLEGSGESGGSIYTSDPSIYSGDFASPEQIIPPHGVVDETGAPIPWEACITLNNNWGYAAADRNYKSSTTIIRKLVECVSKNGNMLLNVGPDAKGVIPKESLDVLEEIGDWMSKNSDSIYGCAAADYPKPEWGRYTQKGNKLYAHVFEESIGPINLIGMADKVKKARLLADGYELFLSRPWSAAEFTEDAFVNFTRPEHFTYPLPDKRNTVIELELIDEPDRS